MPKSDPPHIVILTTGLTGMRNASLAAARKLKSSGMHVTYLCPEDDGQHAAAAGIEYHPIVDWRQGYKREGKGGASTSRLLSKISQSPSARRTKLIAELHLDSFTDALKELSPTLLLLDIEMHEHIIKANSVGVQTVLISQWFCGFEQPGLPPLSSRTIPVKNATGALSDYAKEWKRVKTQARTKEFRTQALSGFTDRKSIIDAIARTNGFDLSELEKYVWPSPYSYRTIPIISLTAAEMEFPYESRENFQYGGPMVWHERDTVKQSAESSALLSTIQRLKGQGHRIIYCSASTMRHKSDDFPSLLLGAIATSPKWHLIMSTSGKDASFRSGIPSNATIVSFAPQLEVLRHSDCCIHHAGIHTIQECISLKVPMVVYSGGKYDQNGCSARIAYHNLGVTRKREQLDAETIRQDIAHAMEDPSYISSNERMQNIFRRYDQKNTFVNLVRSLITSDS